MSNCETLKEAKTPYFQQFIQQIYKFHQESEEQQA